MIVPKAFYSTGELATMTGTDRRQLLRLLRSNGVEIARSGKKYVVFLNGLKQALPDLWDSILDRDALAG